MKRVPPSCRSYRGVGPASANSGSALLPVLLCAIALAACSRPPSESGEPRPVRAVEVRAESSGWLQFAGEVKARYEAKVGFRVSGKILRRYVNAGDRVKTGTAIAELDGPHYRPAAGPTAAQLKAARADLAFAQDDLQRYRELRDQQLISSAEFDRHETTTATLRERGANFRAQLEQARNQVAYT